MGITPSVSASAPLTGDQMATVRRQAIFECCKWDHQVGDVSTLANYTLVISADCWAHLASTAEQLFRETLLAEAEIAARAELIARLALPGKLESVLLAQVDTPPALDDGLRVMRFDFHPTAEGWRVSEVNSDVPGGYVEAAGFSALMARHYSDCTLAADPALALAAALRARTLPSRVIGLVHATAYSDDRQVMVFLQRVLEQHGFAARLLSPADVDWIDGRAQAQGEALGAVFRFFPVEWLPNLAGSAWKKFFEPTATLQTNPGRAAISQSKRFPLTWPRLRQHPAQWSECLPETVAWQNQPDDAWVSKPAFGRVGDGIGLLGATTPREWKEIRTARARRPRDWIAQRRFVASPCTTPAGEAYPCLGIYVIDGRAAGIYGRIAPRPLIDHHAQDIAVLVTGRTSATQPSVKTA